MEELQIKLVHKTSFQRFYKANKKLTKAPNKNFNLQEELPEYIKRLPPEAQELIKTLKEGYDIICVSDATTHIERLVFMGIEYLKNKDSTNPTTEYSRTSTTTLDGKMTFMIYGGDEDAVHPDTVYLRRIARANGYSLKILDN